MKAIVIGSTSGIGRQLAKILVREGYEVGVIAQRPPDLITRGGSFPRNSFNSRYFQDRRNNVKSSMKLSAIFLSTPDLTSFCILDMIFCCKLIFQVFIF